jgi:hypothetical protein
MVWLYRQEQFKGLGMSGVCSDVLGNDVLSGSVGSDKIDGATGLLYLQPHWFFVINYWWHQDDYLYGFDVACLKFSRTCRFTWLVVKKKNLKSLTISTLCFCWQEWRQFLLLATKWSTQKLIRTTQVIWKAIIVSCHEIEWNFCCKYCRSRKSTETFDQNNSDYWWQPCSKWERMVWNSMTFWRVRQASKLSRLDTAESDTNLQIKYNPDLPFLIKTQHFVWFCLFVIVT